jgi:hypothetical protein
VELVGYAGSALVVASLAMTSVVRLRVLSLLGSLTFLAYGGLIGSVPIVITNGAIIALNAWFLRNELGLHRDLGVSPIAPDAPFLADFLQFHLDDIRRFQPGFTQPGPGAYCLLLLRDGLPAGAVVGHQDGEELHIALDYVLRPYRDSRLGTWLFGRGSSVFRASGISRLVTHPGNEAHRGYLERVGFRSEGDHYVLELGSRPQPSGRGSR